MNDPNIQYRPPQWPDWLLGWFCHEDQVEILRGDLYELYEQRRKTGTKFYADARFLLDVLDLFRPFALKKRKDQNINQTAMLKNYIKITRRTFTRQRVYSLLNVSGLSIGLACFILIFLYIQDELSYDGFHSSADRTYRVVEHFESEGVGEHSASLPFPTGPTLINDFPGQIKHAVRLFNFQSPNLALANREADKAFNESRVFFADSTFFDVFDFTLEAGNRKTALDAPNAVLITRSMAKKYFDEEDPMGKFLEFQGTQNLLVTGILEDAPHNAHFQYDFIISFSTIKYWYNGQYPTSWYWNPCWTYVVLEENTLKEDVESLLPDFVLKYFPEFISNEVTLELQPLKDIHLYSRLDYEIQANGNIQNVYIFGAVALFVLIIAAINFINLSTARANKRAKEVGVRKSLGSAKIQLIYQFVLESVLLTSVAVIIAVAIVILILPEFNLLTGRSLDIGILSEANLITGLVVLTLLVGLVSGFYPAFVLSSFNTVSVLKNAHLKTRGLTFRRILVTVQFMISIMLITGTFVAIDQLGYLQNKDVGFDQGNVLMIPVIRSNMGEYYETFRNNALQSTSVRSMTAVEEIVGAKHQVGNYQFEGMERSKPFPRFFVLHDFTKTMDIELVAGRDYDRSVVTDDSLALVVNEALVKSMGWGSAEEAINKRFYFRKRLIGRVIGVVRDYNFVSKHNPIGPLMLPLNTHPRAFDLFIKYVSVKIDGDRLWEAVTDLENAWHAVLPDRPFDYFFLDDRLNDSYLGEQKLSKVTIIFSGLAILVACLGLFGLATFSVEQRTKEIGVRKVLGISTPQILLLLSREFMPLILIAFVLAVPVSYVLLSQWLSAFAYRVGIEAGPFVVAGAITALVCTITVAYNALKASRINPTDTLKYE